MNPTPENRQPEPQDEPAEGWRKSLLVFFGFALLGAALALLFFGRDLFADDGGRPAAIVGPAEVTSSEQGVLGQVSELPPGDSSQDAAADDDGVLEVGDTAYDFTLDDLDGRPVSLSDFRGRPVVVNFWATWCAPCRLEMPVFEKIYEQHQDDGLAILALNQSEQAAVARDFFYDEMGLTFTPLLDKNSDISALYGSYSVLPSTFFIDADGKVVAIHRGPLTEGLMLDYLAAAGVGN
ncbi:MAG: TlpA disulfide reductase family protein [Candidatus Promineifilaceae bacterium]|jgi:peroxiredoxin